LQKRVGCNAKKFSILSMKKIKLNFTSFSCLEGFKIFGRTVIFVFIYLFFTGWLNNFCGAGTAWQSWLNGCLILEDHDSNLSERKIFSSFVKFKL
jgi:hypothetical protein